MLEIAKLKVPPAYQAVSNELQKIILNGVLKPGDPLPGEIELATKFGVNRSTVREGIRQLETEGLVRRIGRKRLVVTIPAHTDLAPKTTRALLMHEVKFRELWEVAYVLEPLSAELAARHAGEEDIAALKDNLERMSGLIDRGEPIGDVDLEFHTLLAQSALNQALLLSREPVGLLLYPAFEAFSSQIPQAAGRNLHAHQQIVSAVENRDEERASKWMRKHIEDLRRGWLLADLGIDDRIDPTLTY